MRIYQFCILFLVSNTVFANNFDDTQYGNKPIINWKISNPFPFIENKYDFEFLKSGLQAIEKDNDYSVYSQAVKQSYKNTLWNRETRSYKKKLVQPDTISISVNVTNLPDSALCAWSGNSKDGSTHQIEDLCNKPVNVNVGFELGNNLELTINADRKYTYTIKPKRKIIIGMGDSFSSGEGNPDKKFDWNEQKIEFRDAKKHRRNWANKYKASPSEMSDWNDPSCHRSLYSWQFLHALNLAGQDPHEFISFASFACSGAEIYDGLLTPQTAKDNSKGYKTKAPDSQLNEAKKLLCLGNTKVLPQEKKYHLRVRKHKNVNTLECNGKMLKTDKLLLSIGGNDIGFSGLISWASFPYRGYNWFTTNSTVRLINNEVITETEMACPYMKRSDWRCRNIFNANEAFQNKTNGNASKNWLLSNLNFTYSQIAQTLDISKSQITNINYPPIQYDQDREMCNLNRSLHASRSMKNLFFSRPFIRRSTRSIYTRYQVGPAPSKMKVLSNDTQNKLNDTILEASRNNNFIDVTNPFMQHGFCATKGKHYELEMVTKYGQRNNNWQWWPEHLRPATYNPWRSVQRWYRTPNDAQMTMHEDALYGNEAWSKGMFHPNHLGHYSIYKSVSQQ